jgi:uncharacterized membrane protein YozB (DUF420 family)
MSSLTRQGSWVAWAAIALLCLLYGPMAMEYTWRLFHPGSPGLWDHTYAAIVDQSEAYGSGSIHDVQADIYPAHRVILLFHTTAGGVAIMLFAAQFSARFRRNLRRHRVVGRTAATIALVGMVGSFAYLISVGPADTFDGPGFYLQLWALGLGTFLSVSLGVVAAVKRQITMHQPLMALAFSLLLTAPLLRIGYLVLGRAWPETTQLETNLAGAAILATWAPFGAFLAARTMPVPPRRHPDVRAWSGHRATVVAVALAVPSAVLLARLAAPVINGLERVAACCLIAWVLALTISMARLLQAKRAEQQPVAEEWHSMVVACLAVAPTFIVTWWMFDVPFTQAEAFVGSMLIAPAVPIVVALIRIIWRRRRLMSPSTPRPVPAAVIA